MVDVARRYNAGPRAMARVDGELSYAERREAARFFADSDDEIVDETIKKHFSVSHVGPAIAVPPIKVNLDRVCLHPASEKPPPSGNVTLTPGPMAHFPMGLQMPHDPRYGHMDAPDMGSLMRQMHYGLPPMAFGGKGAGKGALRRPLPGKIDADGFTDRTGIEEFLAWALSPHDM